MPAWIWPKNIKADTTGAVRLGRVFHWIGLIFAAAFSAALLGVVSLSETGNNDTETIFFSGLFGLLAAVSTLLGRALRYIISGE